MSIGVQLDQAIENLSPAQKAVVTHEMGPLLVVAGAGSGKTRALTYRTAHLVRQGTAPEQVLICTFTTRATKEFQERLHHLLGEQVHRLGMGTLHATGAKVLRQYGEIAGYHPKFVIYDGKDSYRVVKQAAAQAHIPKEQTSPSVAYHWIGRWKEQLMTPGKAQLMAEQLDDMETLGAAQIYERYQDLLEEAHAMDFGDLVMNTVNLLQSYPSVRHKIGLRHLLVDEFQDTDQAQLAMIQGLLPDEENLTAVGDIDQAIYSFRGADHRIMCNFVQHFPNATIRPLGKNYRCSGNIVKAAASVITTNRNRIDHEISTDNEDGEPLVIMPVADEVDEAIRVAQQVRVLHTVLSLPYREMAVLYRTNLQSQLIEEQLLNYHVPYQVVGKKFFERREIMDALLYLKVLDCPDDTLSLEDLLDRPRKWVPTKTRELLKEARRKDGLSLREVIANPGDSVSDRDRLSLAQLDQILTKLEAAAKVKSLPDLLRYTLHESGLLQYYMDRDGKEQSVRGTSAVDNLNRLVTLVQTNHNGQALEVLPEFLAYVALMSDDSDEGNKDGVQLMTLHAAKGTEYQVVFILGCEENIIPHWRAMKETKDPEEAIEEERRLFYVGMTRAKRVLYLMTARTRQTQSGKSVRSEPSRFLKEIPSGLMVRWQKGR